MDTEPSFIGSADSMTKVYRVIDNTASSNAPVMITGETGTGKELAANAIHKKSARGKKDIVILNCAAIPRELLESEIFGHIKGAFTGATSDRTGAASLAHRGTLFLDEVSEMPIEIQAKLLRFVQTGVFSPVGSRQSITADIRFISATNRPPQEAIQKGHLREDLFYRLSVIPLTLPPLRARGRDILMLAQNFLIEGSQKENKAFTRFSSEAEDALLHYPWPGNVRQLENIVRNAIVMNSGDTIMADMLDLPRAPKQDTLTTLDHADLMPLADVERATIERAIHLCSGNITDAAKRLHINPSTIHRKQKEWKCL